MRGIEKSPIDQLLEHICPKCNNSWTCNATPDNSTPCRCKGCPRGCIQPIPVWDGQCYGS